MKQQLAKYAPDMICLAGLGMLGTGLFMLEPWLSLTVCGSLLILAGLRLGRS